MSNDDTISEVKSYYSDGNFAISGKPFRKKQHSNQRNGLDVYVNLLNLRTGNWNTCKLYKNTKGYYSKLSGFSPVYLQKFTNIVEVVFYGFDMLDIVVESNDLILEAERLDVG